MMKILIIGGTRFQGRYLCEDLLKNGHEVSLANRGNYLIPEAISNQVTHHICDRTKAEDTKKLANYQYDVCIDTCAYKHTDIQAIENINAKKYVLISSVLVYQNTDDEVSEETQLKDRESNDRHALNKIRAENQIKQLYPGNKHIIARPSILIGKGDHTERILLAKLIARAGYKIKIKEHNPLLPIIDVRDYTKSLARIIEEDGSGTFNITGTEIYLDDLWKQLTTDQKNCEEKIFEKKILERVYAPFTEFNGCSKYRSTRIKLKTRVIEESLRSIDEEAEAGRKLTRQLDNYNKWRKIMRRC